ncbi:hypothetical protein [Candidatus Nanohalovita haloferacivicina]|uniref:hypothetical protein n=1 Tax=Candidatus Nanohalovita haloferacivicina TaxID=2978046 RepID=UPI00325FAFC0|nr:putative membrane protein [Candidatus Nanohalobia archaeon BNXNv]
MSYEYEAGSCNINRYQQKRRYLASVIGFAAAGTVALFSYSFQLHPLMTLAVFIATMVGFEGLYQGRFSFCTGFASKGIRSKGEEAETEEVPEEQLEEDREMARRIHYYSLLSSAFVTALFYTVTYAVN